MKLHNASSKDLISAGIESRTRVSSALGFESSCKSPDSTNPSTRDRLYIKVHQPPITKQDWLETEIGRWSICLRDTGLGFYCRWPHPLEPILWYLTAKLHSKTRNQSQYERWLSQAGKERSGTCRWDGQSCQAPLDRCLQAADSLYCNWAQH